MAKKKITPQTPKPPKSPFPEFIFLEYDAEQGYYAVSPTVDALNDGPVAYYRLERTGQKRPVFIADKESGVH